MKKLKFKAVLLTVLMLAAGNSSAYWGENFVNKVSNLSKEQIIHHLGDALVYIPALLFLAAREGSPESARYAKLVIVGWAGWAMSRWV